jgi:hypothetical protein
MTSTPSRDSRPAGIVALEISVATVHLALDDMMEKAGELTDPLCTHWTEVGTAIREALATALAGHEQKYASWPRPTPSPIDDA